MSRPSANKPSGRENDAINRSECRRWHAIAGAVMSIMLGFTAQGTTPADRPVRVFTSCHGDCQLRTGSLVQPEQLLTILFTEAPCPLDLVGREHMHRAWRQAGAYQLGCWYPTTNGGYVYINGAGMIFPDSVYWESFPRALLHADGTASITEPGVTNVDNFMNAVSNRKILDFAQHLREQP